MLPVVLLLLTEQLRLQTLQLMLLNFVHLVVKTMPQLVMSVLKNLSFVHFVLQLMLMQLKLLRKLQMSVLIQQKIEHFD